MFNHDEKKHARSLKKTVIKHSSKSEEILFNSVYISTATRLPGEDDLRASEEPGAINREIKFVLPF